MVLSPTFGVRNVHLVAQNVPYHAGLLPHFKRFDGCQTVQSVKHLVVCERAAIATAEYLFKQLPNNTVASTSVFVLMVGSLSLD